MIDIHFIRDNVSSISQAKRESHRFHSYYLWVMENSGFIDRAYKDAKIPFSLRVSAIIAGMTSVPTCPCGELVSFKGDSFGKFCSVECQRGANLTSSVITELNDREWLHEHRINRRMSHAEIAALLNCSEFPVRKALKKFGLNNERYNESNPHAKAKLRDRDWLIEHHVTKHLKCSEIAELLGISKSTVSVALAKHGIDANPPNAYPRIHTKISRGHAEIMDFLGSLGVSMVANDRTVLNGQEIDILLPDHGIGIEYHELYHHIYRPHEDKESLIKGPSFHRGKYVTAAEKGIHLIQIFEDLWQDKPEIVKNILLSKIGKTHKIYARKCKIVEVSNADKRVFLDTYHIQGNDRTSVRIGLEYEGRLVAIMTFNRNRRTSKYGAEWELCRFCTVSGMTVVGGFSKLLKHFRSMHSGSIISYSDCMWSNGGVYGKNGFRMVYDGSKAGYYYVTPNYMARQHRSNFRKDKIAAPGDTRTEFEIMHDNGYHVIFDAGIKTWLLD